MIENTMNKQSGISISIEFIPYIKVGIKSSFKITFVNLVVFKK